MEEQIGRNEPCPCGSGKKYKRCHGAELPRIPGEPGMPGFPPGFDPNSLDPEMVSKFMMAMQRLPKGQLQRIQVLMQKAMAGKDVSREAAELEKALPPDFQEMMRAFAPETLQNMGQELASPNVPPVKEGAPANNAMDDLTPERAREIVMEAVESGKLSEEEAKKFIHETMTTSEPTGTGSKFSKLWKSIKGK